MAIQDTHKVSDTANNIQENKVDENIETNKVSNKNLNENTIITKNTRNTNLKTATTITNWEELQSALKSAGNKDINLF